MDAIERLLAIEEIKTLKARYFRCMDLKDWAGLRAVFTDDLHADFREGTDPPNPQALIAGADAYIAMLAPILANITTVHHGHMPEIAFTSPKLATGIWAMEDKLWVGPGATVPYTFLHGYGHYHETYRHEADGWRIASVRLTRLRIDIS
ncbi:nuclear transport factor 2 family protein [Edaphosphingomonas haloaromaticamans]|uniref:Bile acid 7-alpha dehydratase n=1 Tax=Edaphosphingomonas haloaromaticamans TaxID=653954 RepID=A0A1S1HC85_9SPHN|nr:nuclear transport factor 2 family protein [Sphingomonas haloaromaticamans]OHT19794.1 Bile acid 7-alpha dehydratase [Sphingomonas haloaromaticamans]